MLFFWFVHAEGVCRDWVDKSDLPCNLIYSKENTFAVASESTLYNLVTVRLLTDKEYHGKSHLNINGMMGFQLKYEIAKHLLSPQPKYIIENGKV